MTWRELVVAVALASAFYLLKQIFFSRRQNTSMRRYPLRDDKLEQLVLELDALKARVAILESGRADSKDSETYVPRSVFDYAIQYAQEGMLPQEIATRTGISISEATLIVTMYKEGR